MIPNADVLDHCWAALHRTGPEFDGLLSNHGPMVVEALVRNGRSDRVETFLNGYLPRLVDPPQTSTRITAETWQEALGDRRRLGDWPVWFAEQLDQEPWTEVLRVWWPRLLPGIVAGATHGVIRVGHAVFALRNYGPSPERLDELALALGYWAARYLPLTSSDVPHGVLSPGQALAALPRIDDQSGGVRIRLERLEESPWWARAQHSPRDPHNPHDAELFLRDLVNAAAHNFGPFGHASPVLMVHAITAPTAVLRVLPSLPTSQWKPSAKAAWLTVAALTATFASREPFTPDNPGEPAQSRAESAEDVFDRAAWHGDEHVIKLADAVLGAHQRTGQDSLLNAVHVACERIARPA